MPRPNRLTLPVTALFEGDTQPQLIEFAITEANSDEWYRSGELADAIGATREGVRDPLKQLICFGVYDVKDPDVNIPQYSVANTPVIDALQSSNIDQMFGLFETEGKRKLLDFFLTAADPDHAYSQNDVIDASTAGFDAVSDYIEDLADAGILDRVEGVRATRYQFDANSDLVEQITELNEVVYDVGAERECPDLS